MEFQKGVSIVICCHNSSERLPETILRLNQQVSTDKIPWEVIIVDNGSTDNTSDVAKKLCSNINIVNFRVIKEKKIGLVNARICGLENAQFDVISFIDDDNWVCEDWVAKVHNIFMQKPEIGACGGLNTPVFEIKPPWWFEKNQTSYAVGPQSDASGDITWKEGVLSGAGLSIRKDAWTKLLNDGFRFTLMGRQGKRLSCGEDYELCLALRAAGWKIWYAPELTLEHYLPKSRLNWLYLRRMVRNYGFVKLRLAAYGYNSYGKVLNRTHLMKTYRWQLFAFRRMAMLGKNIFKFVMSHFIAYEGDDEVILIEIRIGELAELFHLKKKVIEHLTIISNAKWNLHV